MATFRILGLRSKGGGNYRGVLITQPHVRPFFLPRQKKKTGKKRKPVIHGLGGWLARPSRHFVILEDSENGKVQKVSPEGFDLQKKTAK